MVSTKGLLVAALGCVGGAKGELEIDAVNPLVVKAEYAVRGMIL